MEVKVSGLHIFLEFCYEVIVSGVIELEVPENEVINYLIYYLL